MTPQDVVRSVAIHMINQNGIVNLTRADLCQQSGIKNGSFNAVMGVGFIEFIESLRAEGITGPHVKVTKKRVHPALRRDQLLQSAAIVAERDGFGSMTREAIAEQAGVTPQYITATLGTMKNLKRSLMRYAIESERIPVLAQGIASGNPYAVKAPEHLKTRVIEWMSKRGGEEC